MSITEETRRKSHEAVKQSKVKRQRVILDLLKESDGMTAREIVIELFKKGLAPACERNYTSPRLTELLKIGLVKVVGKRKCEFTGRCVAVWEVTERWGG